MKKYIPLELSVAQRLAAVQLENPFCGFCRAERAAVEELKEVLAKPAAQLFFSSLAYLEELEQKQALSPTGRLPSQPALPGERVSAPGTELFSSDFTAVEERAAAHYGTVDECDPLDKAVLSAQMPGPAPAEDGLNRQIQVYDMAPSEKPTYRCSGSFDAGQAQATIQEMGELIDQQAAELQSLRDPGKVTVSRDALARVIWALEGAPHLIRELQVTRGLPGLPVNPIDLLVEQLRSPKAE